MFPAKLVLSQSARFEFKHQPLDLLTASSFPPGDFFVSSHPNSPAKKLCDA
jgi:hypothetical protein